MKNKKLLEMVMSNMGDTLGYDFGKCLSLIKKRNTSRRLNIEVRGQVKSTITRNENNAALMVMYVAEILKGLADKSKDKGYELNYNPENKTYKIKYHYYHKKERYILEATINNNQIIRDIKIDPEQPNKQENIREKAQRKIRYQEPQILRAA